MDAHRGHALSALRVNRRRLKPNRQINRRKQQGLDNMFGGAEWAAGAWVPGVIWSVIIAARQFLIKEAPRLTQSIARVAEHK